MHMIVFEDAGFSRLAPLAQTRPVYELRCGAVSLLERQRRCLAADTVAVLVRPELADLCRHVSPERPVNEPVRAGGDLVVLVNGRWLAPNEVPAALHEPHAGMIGDRLAYLVVPGEDAAQLTVQNAVRSLATWQERLPARRAGGVLIDHPWDLVEHNARALLQDERHWQTHRPAVVPAGLTVQGPIERFLADPTARVEPLVLIDTTRGPVMLDRSAVIEAFSRLEGPCYVGPGTHVLAGRVRGSSIGAQCRIGGEVESAIVHGHSNKAHEGFLGHSYVGEWVNFGAGTQTSDLRNDYGTVSVTVNGQRIDTGLLKVGAFVGDHTKTSMNTLFNTGSVCGAFGMLVTSGELLPRSLPAFCQVSRGLVRERTDLGAMFATAATMMARRGQNWAPVCADFYLDLHERTSSERHRLVRDREQRRLRSAI
jgi:UDP-N-acetylglucosamine diphosphorylase/glucosamine-1-phosphate N-acetyltransferase